jgi:hypothetical protein
MGQLLFITTRIAKLMGQAISNRIHERIVQKYRIGFTQNICTDNTADIFCEYFYSSNHVCQIQFNNINKKTSIETSIIINAYPKNLEQKNKNTQNKLVCTTLFKQ